MASTRTVASGAKKRTFFGARKARKKSAGRRRNGAIASSAGKAAKTHAAGTAANDAFLLPRLEFEMALEVAGMGDKGWGDKNWGDERWGDERWTEIVRDAAEAVGGDLLFVLPCAKSPDAKDDSPPADANSDNSGPDNSGPENCAPENCAPENCAMIRLLEDGESRLLLVRASKAGFHLVEETTIEPGLARFAYASIEVLERLGADKRIVAPLTTLARH